MVASAGSLASRLLEAVFATEVLGVCFWKSDGQIVDANDAFLRIAGLTREDLEAGRVRWDDLTPPEAAAADERAREQLAATGQCATYEKEIVCPDGRRVPLLCSAVASGADCGIAFCIDISERRHAEASASARARELAEVQRLAHIGSWRSDPIGDDLVFSDEVYRIWGRAPGEVGPTMRETIDTVVHPDDRERLHALVAEGVTNRTIAYRIVRPDGEVRHVEASSAPLLDGYRIVAFAGVVQDVTERAVADSALRNS
jgi:PAS domain S-box-containing protein